MTAVDLKSLYHTLPHRWCQWRGL